MRLLSPVRSTALGLAFVAVLATACDETKTQDTDLPTAGSSQPAVNLVVRTVEIKKSMTTPSVVQGGDDDEWTAVDGKVYAIVTVDMAHNACKAGDKIETSKAALVADSGKIQPVGGGSKAEKLCVQCQPTEALDCNSASRLRPFVFIFEVDEGSDVTKTKLTYHEQEAPLSVAKLTDSRANDEVALDIEEKKAELTQLRKQLENTSNMARGAVLQGEMERIQKELDVLEKKKK